MAQNKKVDITPGGVIPVLHVSQFDVGRTITFNLMDNTEAYTVPSGATVKIHGTKPSGLGFTVTGSVSGSVVTISTTDVMTDEYGLIPCELSITSGNTILGTANMTLDVEMAPHTEDTIDGRADRLIPELTLLVRELEATAEHIEEVIAEAEVLKDSEAWAVGTRDGVPVDEEDPTYHNNAKYYTDKLGEDSAAAADSAEEAAAHETASAASASNANYQRAAAEEAKSAAQAAQAAAEQAAQDAASAFSVIGNVAFTVLPNGQVREIWTEEE